MIDIKEPANTVTPSSSQEQKQDKILSVQYLSDKEKILAGNVKYSTGDNGEQLVHFTDDIYDVTEQSLQSVFMLFANQMLKEGEKTYTLQYEGIPYILTMLPIKDFEQEVIISGNEDKISNEA